MLNPQIVKLNVGGRKFQTTTKTLMKFPNSYFAEFLNDEVNLPVDRDDYYFIDRSGESFQYILEYLRSGQLIQPEDDLLKNILYEELAYYKIPLKQGSANNSMIRSKSKSKKSNKNKSSQNKSFLKYRQNYSAK